MEEHLREPETYDFRRYDRLWQRVAPGLEPYPAAGAGTVVPAAGGAAETPAAAPAPAALPAAREMPESRLPGALENAKARFPLTWREADIIRSHMFPYTPTKFYRCAESAVVSTVDKLCAAAELLGLVRPGAGAREEIEVDFSARGTYTGEYREDTQVHTVG